MEMPHFERLYNESSHDDLIIIGISNEDEAKVRSFVAQKGIDYPYCSFQKSRPRLTKNIKAIPTTFFIDRKGIVQSVFVGSRDFNQLKDRALTADFQATPKSARRGPSPNSRSRQPGQRGRLEIAWRRRLFTNSTVFTRNPTGIGPDCQVVCILFLRN